MELSRHAQHRGTRAFTIGGGDPLGERTRYRRRTSSRGDGKRGGSKKGLERSRDGKGPVLRRGLDDFWIDEEIGYSNQLSVIYYRLAEFRDWADRPFAFVYPRRSVPGGYLLLFILSLIQIKPYVIDSSDPSRSSPRLPWFSSPGSCRPSPSSLPPLT